MAEATDFSARFDVRVITGIRVAMRDGVELNVRIMRPKADGRFPAVLEYNPYRRLSVALPDYRDEFPPVVPYLAERGYVVVQYDVRGTGSSSGFSTDMYSEDERRDGHDMVEWCAAQKWCTGVVGLVGKSYGAVVQWQVAVQNPPHLKAIAVRSGGDDIYAEFSNPGGCIRPWMFENYGPMMNAFNFSPPDPLLVGERWAAIWQERLERSSPWSLSFIRNLQQGPYWRSRSVAPDYDRVQCAVLLIEGWADWYATAELRSYQRLRTPRRVIIGPWGHYYPEEREAYPGPRIDARREYLKWFDRFLKDIDNGVTEEPPVTVFVRTWRSPALVCPEDAGTWRSEAAWPPTHVRETPYFLGDRGKLAEVPEEGSETYRYRPSVGVSSGRVGIGSTTPWGTAIDQRHDDAFSVVYDTDPLTEEREILGEPQAILHVSSTAEVAYFSVRLCDVSPDGESRLVSDGGLLATHRRSHENPEPLVRNEVIELRLPLRHCAYTLAPGHRLRVTVASAAFQNAWPTGQAADNTVHRGPTRPSRVVLPIAGARHRELPAPDFVELPLPANSAHSDAAADLRHAFRPRRRHGHLRARRRGQGQPQSLALYRLEPRSGAHDDHFELLAPAVPSDARHQGRRRMPDDERRRHLHTHRAGQYPHRRKDAFPEELGGKRSAELVLRRDAGHSCPAAARQGPPRNSHGQRCGLRAGDPHRRARLAGEIGVAMREGAEFVGTFGQHAPDLLADDAGRERDIGASQTLGERDEVRLDAIGFAAEHATRPAEPCNHLVGDQQDIMAPEHRCDRSEISVRRRDDPAGAKDGFCDESGDCVRPFREDQLLEFASASVGKRLLALAGLGRSPIVGHARVPDSAHGQVEGGMIERHAGQAA